MGASPNPPRNLEPDSGLEADRLAVLNSLHILDTAPEVTFDTYARLAAVLAGSDLAIVSLCDGVRHWFKAKVDLDQDEAPCGGTFCDHTLASDTPVWIADAAKDARFRRLPCVA